jgi:hypothetical protein
MPFSGADPGFQVRGVYLKKLRRAEGGTKIFGVFRVKNPDFTQKIIFFPILGGVPPPPWFRPCYVQVQYIQQLLYVTVSSRKLLPPLINLVI